MRVETIFPIVVFNGWTPFGKYIVQRNIKMDRHSMSHVFMPYRGVSINKKRR
jgi:hypothetical protein